MAEIENASSKTTDGARVIAAARALDEAKHHLAYSLGHSSEIPHYVAERASATGDDVLSAAEVLVQEYLRAEAGLAAFVASEETSITFSEARRLETAFKSVHMWLRAYQDGLCGVLLAIIGETVGAYSSMRAALRQGRPVAEFLAQSLPEYETWFTEWRHRRDQMKLGAHFRTVFETDPPRIPGIEFAFPRRVTGTELDEGFISLDDIIDGLAMSTSLTEVVRAALEAKAKADPGSGPD